MPVDGLLKPLPESLPRQTIADALTTPWTLDADNPNLMLDSPFDRPLREAVTRGRVGESVLDEKVEDHTDGRGVDVAIEASGARPAVETVPHAVRRGGTAVLVGLSDETVPFDVVDLIDNEIDIHPSFRYANTYPTAVELLADDRVDVTGFVDFEAGLSEVESAFQRAMDPETVTGVIQL
jgi:threonine dehydrogenase-like Zn-dependent dehydrogenase